MKTVKEFRAEEGDVPMGEGSVELVGDIKKM